ncbi:hypothetical protein [Oceanobacillus oncorhynchi]|uniref:hypothetical protein n=1 Tax=Oceanobacillus oncorhynchi TaxID=545501 RepID=UPI0018682A5C|nr:hypothetical protein [Oceanobacillus oncorhynchi]
MQSAYTENKEDNKTILKEYVEINGAEQGIIVESLNQNKPLLLFLHGGPGFPAYPRRKYVRIFSMRILEWGR